MEQGAKRRVRGRKERGKSKKRVGVTAAIRQRDEKKSRANVTITRHGASFRAPRAEFARRASSWARARRRVRHYGKRP